MEVSHQVALGRWHSLVLGSVVWAFGWGRFGVLGQGDFNDHHSPVRRVLCGAGG